jgi:hypothetical protein
MPAVALFKKYWPWTGLALPLALIAIAAVLAPGKVGRMELEREAHIAAKRIATELGDEPSALIDAFAKPSLAPHLGAILDASGYGGRVLRYELYDDAGRLSFTSGKAGLVLDHGDPKLTGVAPVREPGAALYKRSGPDVTDFAVLALPLKSKGRTTGTLLVYLDQSDQATVLYRYFGLIAAITLILLGAGVATPAALCLAPKSRTRAGRGAGALSRELRSAYRAPQSQIVQRTAERRAGADEAGSQPNRGPMPRRGPLPGDQRQRRPRRRRRGAARDRQPHPIHATQGRYPGAQGERRVRHRPHRHRQSRRRDGIHQPARGHLPAPLLRLRPGDCLHHLGRHRPIAPADGDTAAEILRHADIALAGAKSDGGQRMRFYEQSMDQALQRRRAVEHELRLGLSREEFEVVYQSQYDLASGAQVGVEAVVRWHHPVHGKIAPAHFISVAEETGLIVPLGE